MPGLLSTTVATAMTAVAYPIIGRTHQRSARLHGMTSEAMKPKAQRLSIR